MAAHNRFPGSTSCKLSYGSNLKQAGKNASFLSLTFTRSSSKPRPEAADSAAARLLTAAAEEVL